MRELRLEVRRDDAVEAHVLFKCAAPHRVLLRLGLVLRLVPYLPVGNLVAKAVRPALRVVSDHMLGDARPLRIVFRRQTVDWRIALFDKVLYRYTETEKRLDSILDKYLDKRVGVDEAVAPWIVFVCIEVGEEVGDIDIESAAEPSPDVVETGIRYAGFLEVVHHRPVGKLPYHRWLADAVHRLDWSN